MPQFDTGTSWDQGLNSLGSILFPDPSKIAQAGLYGAQQRNAKLQGDEEMLKLQALRGLAGGHHPWGDGPAPNYSAPGPGFAPLPVPKGPWSQQQPGPVAPGQGDVPPTTQGPVTAVAPQAPPPPAGPVQLAGGPVQLGGNPAQPPAQATVSPPAIPPGTTTKTLTAIADNPANPLTSGTPPAMSAPTPGAAVTSNATGSNGTLPQNDPTSGPLISGSVLQSDGGVKNASPAAHDGSPAPALDLSALITQAHMAGYTPEETTNLLVEQINEARQANMITPDTYSQMLASLGRTGQLQAQTQITTQGMATGGVEGEKHFEFMKEMIDVRDKDGMVTQVPREVYLKNQGAYTPINPQTATAIAQQNMGYVNVYGRQADGKPDYSSRSMMPRAQAVREGRTIVPESDKPVGAEQSGTEDAAQARDYMIDTQIQDAYKAPPRRANDINDLSRQDKAGVSPEKFAEIRERAHQEFIKDPSLANDQTKFPVAIGRAIKLMQQEHSLPTPEEVAKRRQRGLTSKHAVVGEDPDLINGTDMMTLQPEMRFRVDLAPSPKAQLRAVTTPGQGNAVPPPGTQANGAPQAPNAQLNVPQSGITARAILPPGAKENSVVMSPQNVPMIVHNGVPVDMTPAEKLQYQAHLKGQSQGPVTGRP